MLFAEHLDKELQADHETVHSHLQVVDKSGVFTEKFFDVWYK